MATYASDEYLSALKQSLDVYLPATIQGNIKPKRENAINKAYDGIYDIQLAIISVANDIEVSHLLGINDVVVSHIVEEYAKLTYALRLLDSKLKGLKQFDELKQVLQSITDALKIKDVGKCLYNDLEQLASDHALEFDIKTSVSEMKSYQVDEKFLMQLGAK